MVKTVQYSKWPKDINFAEKIKVIDEIVRKEFRLRRTNYGFRGGDNTYHLTKNQTEHYTCDSYKEFLSVISSVPYFESFDWHSTYVSFLSKFDVLDIFRNRYGVWIDYTKRNIEVSIHSNNKLGFIERVHELVKNELNLNNPNRIDNDNHRRKMLQPTIFVARHFDNIGNMYFAKLSSFLDLLGFAVTQGEEYTSGSIPDKVKNRIDPQDIVIIIISGNRDHTWLISEASYALGKQKHLILMTESNATIETGILGKDLEYICFSENHIEEGYVSLLREFRSIGVRGIFY